MPYITVGDENSANINLYYEDHGKGKPVLLIHGWPLNGASWEKQIPMLLETGHRVITYDRRGFGKSSQPAFGYDYDTFASDLKQIIDYLELQDVTLVGFSMGAGEVARYLGTYGSERISKCAFIGGITPYLLKTADNPSGVDQSAFEDIKKNFASDRFAALKDFLQNFFNANKYKGSKVSEEVIQNCWNVAAAASAKGTFDCINAWLTDFRQDIRTISIPTLVIHGDDDRILPMEATAILMEDLLPSVKLVTVKGGPHGILWTHAEEVNQALSDFLGRSPEIREGRRVDNEKLSSLH